VTAAQAHAHLDHAVPAVASTVRIAPDKIELSFNEAVEPAFSSVEVIDQAGGHIELGKLMPGLDDTKTLRIAIKMTEPGVYWVLWQVLSVDTHRSTGNFTFTLAP
jgi:methionine-rich copper-binding protein CopC